MYIDMAKPVNCHAAATTTGMSAMGIPYRTLRCLAAGKTCPSASLTDRSTDGSVVHPGFRGAEPIQTNHLLIPKPSNRRLIPVSGLKIHRHAIPVTMKDKA